MAIVHCLFFVLITSAETALRDDCCSMLTSIPHDPYCFHLIYQCERTCGVTSWPDYKDFYKYSECKGCECSYCYIGVEHKTLSVGKSCKSRWPNFLQWGIQMISKSKFIPRRKIVSEFRPLSQIVFVSVLSEGNVLPLPWGSALQTYYDFDEKNHIFTIKPTKREKLPRSGHFQLYAYEYDSLFTVLQFIQFNYTWFSPLRCHTSKLPQKDCKDPLLSIDCMNEIQRPIVYSVTNSNFETKGNNVYFKNLTSKGDFEFSITATYADLYDSSTTIKVSLKVERLCPRCSAEKHDNINWPETIADSNVYAPCTKEFTGRISRSCSIYGQWGNLDDSMCVKNSITEAKSTLSKIANMGGDVGPVMAKLADATKDNLRSGDITETMDALDIVSNIMNTRKQVSKIDVHGFVNVVSNLVGEDTKDTWKTLHKKNNLTAASMLKRMDDFGSIASQKINKTISINSENLVLELKKTGLERNIQFPSANENQKDWVKKSNTSVFVPLNILQGAFEANESVAMNAVLFKNMNHLLPKSRNNYSMNSYVLAISFGKPLVNLTENISLTFSHLAKRFEEPSCNFWDFKRNLKMGGSWSTEGCEVQSQSSNSTHTVCICDHLTNFAILMKLTPYKDRVPIGIVTNVFCGISVVALIVTMISYGICWKYVTSEDVTRSQSILLMNLCVSLIIGYVLFLALVEKTGGNIACTVIAALLHYIFLVCFFTMLAEGIDMAIALTVVFTSRISRIPLLFAFSWGGPAIIVGVTLAITRAKGFGNDLFCWLTSENNINLAFIVPVLIIIAANIICLIFIMKALFSAHCMLRKSIKQRLRVGARSVGILTPLLGFTWVFGVFALNEDYQAFEYIFAVANSLQGFFIFLVYCVFNKKIRENVWKKKKVTQQQQQSQYQRSTDTNLSSTKSTSVSETKSVTINYVYENYSYCRSALRFTEDVMEQ